MTGPASIAPGQSAQFTVIVRVADGTAKTPTAVLWRTSQSSLLQITSAGVAVAGSLMGDVLLTADVTLPGGSVRQLTREVVILPDGTYRLVGTIQDAEVPTAPVPGAHVDATPGAASAITDALGNYRLYGLPADASVHVTSDGYEPLEQSVHLTGHASRSFQLKPAHSRLAFAGSYTLTIDAAPGCTGSSALPDDLQHRTYQAEVIQTGVNLLVKLTEPRFRLKSDGRGNHFTGVAGVGAATFKLDSIFEGYYYYGLYPGLIERLSDGSLFAVSGTAKTTGTAAGLSGQLNGRLSTWLDGILIQASLAGCTSSTHQFALIAR